MKLKSLILTAFILASTSAIAQWYPGGWFPAQARVTVLQGQVAAEVFNPHFAPIICDGQVFGQTFQGQIFTAYFGQQFLPAGGFRYAFVNTTPWAPFVHGWTNVHCRYF